MAARLVGQRRHLSNACVVSINIVSDGPQSPTKGKSRGVRTPSLQRCHLSPTYFVPCCIGLSRYIAITNLPIISVFARISPAIINRFQQNLQAQQCAIKHVFVIFSSFLAQAVSEYGAAATFVCHGMSVTVQRIPRLLHTSIICLN